MSFLHISNLLKFYQFCKVKFIFFNEVYNMENNKLITIEAKVNAPIDKVWELWNSPEHIIKWCAASDDWHTTYAESDLKERGKFNSRMEAKDGSFGFDFSGVYDDIEKHKKITYTIDDGRKVWITFSKVGDSIEIIETFEAETENPIEMQKEGWQAILNNFKKYAENKNNWDKLRFSININAPVERVYNNMIGDKTYSKWTYPFNPTSTFEGNWEKGKSINFVGIDENGKKGGMICKVKENIPHKFISLEMEGILKENEAITSGEEVEKWKGGLENYYFFPNGNQTKLEIITDSNEDFKEYFEETWPQALKKLKEICEK